MKMTSFIVGGFLILFGLIWVLQGLNVMMGTAMSGQPLWVWIGAVVLLAGIVLEILGARMKNKSPKGD